MMQTVIRANCDVCGEVELGPDDLMIVRLPPEGDHYVFACCDGMQTRPANKKAVAVLLVAGVGVVG